MQQEDQNASKWESRGEWVVVKEVAAKKGASIIASGSHSREQLGLEVVVAFDGPSYPVGTRLIVNMTVSTAIRIDGSAYKGIPVYNVIMKCN